MTGLLSIYSPNEYASIIAEPVTRTVTADNTAVCRHCGLAITCDLTLTDPWRHRYNGVNGGLRCQLVDIACRDIRASLKRRGVRGLEDPGTLIDVFAGPYRVLSNFGDPTLDTDPITIWLPWTGNMTSDYTENLFQAAKSNDESERAAILAATPGDAKKLGRRCTLVAGWDDRRYAAMEACIDAKFAPGRIEAAALILTGTAALIEGTWWNDRIWGVDLTDGALPGRNLLGSMLMNQRALLNLRGNLDWAELVNMRGTKAGL